MIEILTRWWFAHKVCRKYGITFEPLVFGDYGKPCSKSYLFDAFCTYYQQVDNLHFADGYLMFRKYFGLRSN